MTEHEPSQYETADAHPQIYVVPPEVEERPSIYQCDGKLLVEHGVEIPDHLCICCGNRAAKLVNRSLRNPANPGTWFGKGYKLEVGLCRKHADNAMVGSALTFSVIGLGAFMIAVGLIFDLTPATIVGLISLAISGLFRALVPVTVKDPKVNPVEVSSVSPRYLQMFPPAELVEEESGESV